VSGHDGDPDVPARPVECIPQGGQLLVRDLRWKVQVHGHPPNGKAARGGVGGQDVHGEPRRPVPAVGRDDEHRVGGQRHDHAIGHPHDADVDTVLRAHQDVGIARPQPPQDDLLE
jgi:hypothetical protein